MSLVATLNALDWDSQFFAKKIGLLELGGKQTIADASLSQFDIIQAKVTASDYSAIDLLAQYGFTLAESEAEFSLATQKTERQQGIRLARASHIPALGAVALQLFTQSRYREPWFSSSQKQEFYCQWIENAVFGHFDNLCLLVNGPDGQLAGFVTLRLQSLQARIGLLGVATEAQGRGIGLQLVRAAADWARTQGCGELIIATQLSNLAAMGLYQRAGAKLQAVHHWFYR